MDMLHLVFTVCEEKRGRPHRPPVSALARSAAAQKGIEMQAVVRIDELRAPWLWWAALAIGASYMLPVAMDVSGPAIILWKGAGVGLLALWAAVNGRDRMGQMIALVLGFGALGDVLLETSGLIFGAFAFLFGHAIAIGLYNQNPRPALTGSQRLLSAVVTPLALAITWALLYGIAASNVSLFAGTLFYTLVVAVMAAMAWVSSFPRYRTGVGAMLFLISDLLIFARIGGAVPSNVASMLIWPLYFTGQALIAWGVVTTLAARRR
jgi:YhhN family